jgi:hypothetical protein
VAPGHHNIAAATWYHARNAIRTLATLGITPASPKRTLSHYAGALTDRLAQEDVCVLGASRWQFYVLFQADLDSALHELKERVLADGNCYWPLEGDWCPFPALRSPRPRTRQELDAPLAEKDWPQSQETHSILDMAGVTEPDEDAEPRTVEPVSAHDVQELTGGRSADSGGRAPDRAFGG